jgi:hypothetical protein
VSRKTGWFDRLLTDNGRRVVHPIHWTNLFPPQIPVQPDVGFEIRPFPVSRAAPQKAQTRTFFHVRAASVDLTKFN